MGQDIGSGRGGRRAGAGRPKGAKTRWPPEIAAELRRLAEALHHLQQYRRDEHEALQPILRRLVAIERTPRAPRKSSRCPGRAGRGLSDWSMSPSRPPGGTEPRETIRGPRILAA